MPTPQPRKLPWYYRLPRKLRLTLIILLREWSHHIRLILWSPIELPRLLIFKLGHITLTRGSHCGIRLVGSNFGDAENQVFVACTKDALDLIQRYDLPRFRRILREIRVIDNCPLISDARYNRRFRSCEIDFSHYRDSTGGYLNPLHHGTDEYPRSLAYYAAAIIHEATHGTFDSHGVPYTTLNRLRIEQSCHREEARFYARLEQADPEVFEEIGELLHPFPEDYYEQHWQVSRWERMKQETIRVREAWRNAAKRDRQLKEENRQHTTESVAAKEQ